MDKFEAVVEYAKGFNLSTSEMAFADIRDIKAISDSVAIEPKHYIWIQKDVGICAVIRMPYGRYCGYVEVPEENVFDFDDLSAHGGITYSGHFTESCPYMIGFDTNHGCDLGQFRNFAYVLRETIELAKRVQVLSRIKK